MPEEKRHPISDAYTNVLVAHRKPPGLIQGSDSPQTDGARRAVTKVDGSSREPARHLVPGQGAW